ncbi:MAG TPA: hypothetical protein V6C76_15885 [Drouetiella sp.]
MAAPTKAHGEAEAAHQSPEWLKKETTGKSEAESKLWNSAYSSLEKQNHFQAGEGPSQAVARLQKAGFLTDMNITDEAHKIEKYHGKDGKPQTEFTTKDHVLGPKGEHHEVAKYVESHLKADQVNRLTPSADALKGVMTPERTDAMKKAGLETDPQKLHDAIAKRLTDDKGLNAHALEKMKDVPVGAPYVGTGAITEQQMNSVLREQKAMRDVKRDDTDFKALQKSNPEEYKKQWSQYLHDTNVGQLLRVHAKEDPKHYNIDKIKAADDFIKAVQEVNKKPAT